MSTKNPDQLTVSTTIANTDLLVGYPAGGPMYAITAANALIYFEASSLLLDGSHTMTSALVHAVGSESLPSVTFAGDLDTGWFHVGANSMAGVVGGQKRLQVEATAITALNGAVFVGNLTGNADTATTAGSTSGNAATATKWATGRTLSITGSIAYTSPSLDGSGNVTAAATIANNSDAVTWGGLQTYSVGANLTLAAAPASNAVGFLGLIQTGAKSNDYTLALADSGHEVPFTATKTLTIPANASIAFQNGTVICASVDSGHTLTVAITSDTLTWLPTAGTGSRTVTGPGFITLRKYSSTVWWCWGMNIS